MNRGNLNLSHDVVVVVAVVGALVTKKALGCQEIYIKVELRRRNNDSNNNQNNCFSTFT